MNQTDRNGQNSFEWCMGVRPTTPIITRPEIIEALRVEISLCKEWDAGFRENANEDEKMGKLESAAVIRAAAEAYADMAGRLERLLNRIERGA